MLDCEGFDNYDIVHCDKFADEENEIQIIGVFNFLTRQAFISTLYIIEI